LKHHRIRKPKEAKDLPELPVPDSEAVVCPVCGSVAVQEKCKIICRSDLCRGRVVMNCSEF